MEWVAATEAAMVAVTVEVMAVDTVEEWAEWEELEADMEADTEVSGDNYLFYVL